MVGKYRSKSRNYMAKTRSTKKPRGSTTPRKPQTFRSGFEKKVGKFLKDNKVPFEYETVKLKYKVPESEHTYTPDFILPNGVHVEVKGLFNREARTKMALVKEQHPDKDIRMLFMRNNYISKQSKTKYSDWCEKRGIKYHVSLMGTVPEEWIKENDQD
jgi:hypothetical protein